MKLSQSAKTMRLPYCAAVIVAGGSSSRFGSDKLMADLNGTPVLGRTLEVFSSCACIREIVLVVREELMDVSARLVRAYGGGKVKLVVPGGATRLLSSYAGVASVSARAKLIAIHDGARPLVTPDVILDAVWAAYRNLAAAPAVPVKDTIKLAEDGEVLETPDRSKLFAIQTPQVFQADVIKAALQNAVDKQLSPTDDCAAAELIGAKIHLTQGSEENIKITTPLDLELAKLILKRREP